MNVTPQQKKMIMIGGTVIIALVVIAVGGVYAYKKLKPGSPSSQAQATPAPKKRITDPVNQIPQSDRPFLNVVPKDIHTITLQVNEVKKPATSLEYEVEYQAGDQLEGASGHDIDISQLPWSSDILLGTCSTGGKCTYNTDVKGGTFLAKFTGGSESYAVKQEWNYIENNTKETQFSSRDAKFQLDSKDMATQKIVIIYNTPGYPKTLNGTPISEAYTLNVLGTLKGKGNIIMRANEDATGATIMGWDGQNWQELPSSADGKTVTAQNADLMQVYVVVKK